MSTTMPEKASLRSISRLSRTPTLCSSAASESSSLAGFTLCAPEYEDIKPQELSVLNYNTFEVIADEPPLPDIGLRPWLAVLGGFCAQFCSFGVMNIIGLFITYYESHQLSSLTPSTISWIGSVQSAVFSLAGVFCGRVCDMYGPRYLTITGCGLITVGFISIAFCREYYQFVLAQGICVSMGSAGLFYGTTSSISTWFSARRGVAFGVAASGASIGGIAMSFLFQTVVASRSFKSAVFAMTGVLFFFSFVAAAVTTSRLQPSGRQPIQFVRFYLRPFLEAAFSLFTAAMFLIYMAIFVPMAFFASSGVADGLSIKASFHLIAYLNVGSFFGRLVIGLLSDRVNKLALFFVVTLSTGLVACPFWYISHSSALLIAVCVAYGFFSGGILAMFASIIADISPVSEIGTRVGAVSGSISVATLAALPIAGAIISTGAGFGGMKIYTGTCLIVAAFVVGATKRSVDGKWKLEISRE